MQEEIFELYKPKLEKYIQLNETYKNPESLQGLMEELKRAKRKSEAVLGYFSVKKQKNMVCTPFKTNVQKSNM